jgi:hypothetical protein
VRSKENHIETLISVDKTNFTPRIGLIFEHIIKISYCIKNILKMNHFNRLVTSSPFSTFFAKPIFLASALFGLENYCLIFDPFQICPTVLANNNIELISLFTNLKS